MPENKEELLQQLASNNPVDLTQLAKLAAQLAELARAGIVQPNGYSLDPPLGRPAASQRNQTLANATAPTNSRKSAA